MQTSADPLTSEQTLNVWMNQHYAFIYRLAYSILDNADDADDAAQQAFINAGLHLDEFAGRSSPRTWLAAIAINLCRAELRRRRVRLAVGRSLGALTRLWGKPSSAESNALENERRGQLLLEVQKLDEKHRLPLLLRYVHNLPAAEIATILGISEGTVHSRLHNARSQLAGQLARLGEDFQEAAQ